MSFGESASLFSQVRQDYYNPEVIRSVVEFLGMEPGRRLIDVGCGTGIATRQLAAYGFDVVGIDEDADMIDEAASLGKAAGYRVMNADRLGYPDETFHGATAFSAFHWFCDDTSVGEIKRVLQTGSCFVVVNRTDRGSFRQAMVDIVRRHADLTLAEPRASYRPAELLIKGGFSGVRERTLASTEQLSAETAIAYVRSTRFWQEVPQAFHNPIEETLRRYVMSRIDASGCFPRPITTTIVVGCK